MARDDGSRRRAAPRNRFASVRQEPGRPNDGLAAGLDEHTVAAVVAHHRLAQVERPVRAHLHGVRDAAGKRGGAHRGHAASDHEPGAIASGRLTVAEQAHRHARHRKVGRRRVDACVGRTDDANAGADDNSRWLGLVGQRTAESDPHVDRPYLGRRRVGAHDQSCDGCALHVPTELHCCSVDRPDDVAGADGHVAGAVDVDADVGDVSDRAVGCRSDPVAGNERGGDAAAAGSDDRDCRRCPADGVAVGCAGADAQVVRLLRRGFRSGCGSGSGHPERAQTVAGDGVVAAALQIDFDVGVT